MPKFKIAIADDYPVYRDGLQVTLSSDENLEIIFEADNGQELLEIMNAELPDLVIMDYKMPVMDGMSATRLIKEKYPSVKVLVISMFHDEKFIKHLMDNGADGYLLKEDRFEVLVEELQKIVRGQPPLSPAIARRLLTHFRQSGADGPAPDSGFSSPSGFQTSRPVPIEKPLDHERLTPRESEVLTYLSKGFTIKEIAGLMGIKWFTVNDHIKSIYKKLNVSSRAEAAVVASKQGLV